MSKVINASSFCESVFDGTHGTPKPTLKGYPLITSKHISNNSLNINLAYLISQTDFDEINRRSKIKQWDVLFSMIGTVGEVYLEQNKHINYAIKNIGVFSCGNEYKAKWLYYYFQTPMAKYHIKKSLNGAVQKFLPLGSLRDFPIPILTKDKNKVIDLLSMLDKKIELNNQINAELESMAKTLYDYWFVQFDFPDEKGKPYKSSGGKMVYNSVLKREIPEGWHNKNLSDIANITMGQSPNGESYNENGDGVIFFQGSTDFGWLFPSVRQFTNKPNRLAKKGDILLSVRAPVGDMNIANNDCCIGRGLAAMNSKEGFDGFLFYVMKYFKTIFERRNSEGTTFGSITKNDLHSLPLSYPPLSILMKYDAIMSNYNKMIFGKSQESEQLTKLRDFLLPMLMNGQVTVKE